MLRPVQTNATCCVRLYTKLGYVAWCWHMLRTVWNYLVKLFAQHMPTFLLFSWPMNQVVAFTHEVIVFCNYVYCFVTFLSTFPSSLLKFSVLVDVPGSIFKMAESIGLNFRIYTQGRRSGQKSGGRRLGVGGEWGSRCVWQRVPLKMNSNNR